MESMEVNTAIVEMVFLGQKWNSESAWNWGYPLMHFSDGVVLG
jgi:hypothetical protein